ncbi:MAG: serine hydrolase [Pyrinomonadaceae bacterium]|nr:serine hydrolase [Pyrinomonadaceae bacterium]
MPLSATVSAQEKLTALDVEAGKYADKLRVFEEFVKKQMEADKIPGLSIGFIKDDFTWAKGYGYADIEHKTPATAETVYRLASVTKPMTAMAVLKLVEKGKMNLDAEVQTYVPNYPKQKWPVTIRQLLAHLGGGQVGSGLGSERKSVREVVEAISKHPLETEPGTKFIYTTSGYNLLGAAVEGASGEPFDEYMRNHIWRPLGMNKTFMDNPREVIPNRARGYELVDGRIRNAEFVDVSTRFGGGGASGTVPDLLRFAKGVSSGKVLSKESVDLMYTPVANREGRYTAYQGGSWDFGMGWLLFPLNGRFAAHHDGGQKGTSTELMRVPSENFAIALACNKEGVDYQPYISRLYELIMDEAWEVRAYTRDASNANLYRAMQSVFDYGMLHYDRAQKPLSQDAQELAAAFAYFDQIANHRASQLSPAEVEQKIKDGRHPVAGQAFVKIGSLMAQKLSERYGAERLKSYHKTGAISFFADYVEMSHTANGFPKELRFSDAFEKTASAWNQDWQKTWSAEIRALNIAPGADIDAISQKLRTSFSGAEVYPNFVPELVKFQTGGMEVIKASKLAAELYPNSDRAVGNYAIILLAVGDKRSEVKEILATDDARALMKKSLEINPEGIASAKILNMIANNWANEGVAHRLDKAMDVARLAIELHPKEAVLYDSLGNFHLRKGEKQQAAEQFRKAVEVDPKFEHAQTMLKRISDEAAGKKPAGLTDPKELEAFLDKFFAEQMDKLHIPGAVITVVKDGKLFFTKGYGYSDLEKQRPVFPDSTLFRAYSVSKTFTATAVMQLVERGKLKLDEDVNKYLKRFKLKDNFPEPVTLAHLLTHTAGFVDTDAGVDSMLTFGKYHSVAFGDNLAAHMPPRAKAVGPFRYSNYGASLAGFIVEEVSGEPFEKYIEKHILQPLGMKRSTFLLPYQLAPNVAADVAVGYRYVDGEYQRMSPEAGDFWTAPAANLLTTGTDMAPFMIAQLNQGRYGNARLLKEATFQEMHKQRSIGESPLISYGLFRNFENNQQAVFHNGGYDGAISQMMLLPEHNIGWFVSYTFGGDERRQLRWNLTSALLDRYFPE